MVAHFLDRMIFCMFAEDVGLLPNEVFSQFLKKPNRNPRFVNRDIAQLFEAMAKGGDFYGETIPHFNGNLFDNTPPLDLIGTEFPILIEASAFDWSEMDPSIFGTLFERVMDPAQRSQLGAHYTGYRDIATLVEPVISAPLHREWTEALEKIASLAPDVIETRHGESLFRPADESRIQEAQRLVDAFLARLRSVRVLDPACGSGNFLYVTLRMLKDLEKEILIECRHRGLREFELQVGPNQLFGIEINPYAFDLAQMTVWIGFIQWQKDNGFPIEHEPILQALHNFQRKDAIIDLTDADSPAEPDWPDADFIVGNPPFIGNKRMRFELGQDYCSSLWKLYGDRLPGMSDLCCYWFEKAREMIARGRCRSAGLLATTVIKQVGNRRVLDRITDSGRIFFAVSDRKWYDSGVTIRIAIIGFDRGKESGGIVLDGCEVPMIHADLTSGNDLSTKGRIAANMGLCFMGVTKVGDFDIDTRLALSLLAAPNPHGRPNSDVLRPFRNGSDLVRKSSDRWVIDFGTSMGEAEAALYEKPFAFLQEHVRPFRQNNGRLAYRQKWWIHGEARPGFREAVEHKARYLATARVAKHRIFLWLDSVVLPDSKVIAITSDTDLMFGIIHSRIHEVWALANCGRHGGERGTYNPTTCFETFPLIQPKGAQATAIAAAGKRLNDLRWNWLSPPEWVREEVLEFPGSIDGPWARYVHDPDDRGIGTVRYPRLAPRDAHVYDLAKRTLTNLYNERPTWLDLAHKALDQAVFDAYGWDPSMTDEQILAALLELNLERSASGDLAPTGAESEEQSEEVEPE